MNFEFFFCNNSNLKFFIYSKELFKYKFKTCFYQNTFFPQSMRLGIPNDQYILICKYTYTNTNTDHSSILRWQKCNFSDKQHESNKSISEKAF